jgi:hypothetical protein
VSLWMPPEIRGIPHEARESLQRALASDDPVEFMGLCQEARHAVYMVGRCPDCSSPIGSLHYCHLKQGAVTLDDIVRAASRRLPKQANL